MTWLILLGLLAVAAWGWWILRRTLRDAGMIHSIAGGDPDLDMTELLALRTRGEIDDAAFVRLRDRFEARRGSEGFRSAGRPFTPIMEPRQFIEELDERVVP